MSRYDYYGYFPPSRPIETDDGIKARSQRGQFGKNWWATRWINALEKLLDQGRLSRGLDEDKARMMIVNGFIEPFVKELPMEYAVELNRLIELEMEGSVG